MWHEGRIHSNCVLARERSAQSASTAWIFTGGDGKPEGCSTALELGKLEGGRDDESGTRCFILFWYRKDMAFAVLDEQNQTWLYHLASMSAGGALAEYLTTLQVLKV